MNEDDALSEGSWEWAMYDINNRSDVLPNVTLTASIIKDDWSKRFLKEKSKYHTLFSISIIRLIFI